MKFAFIMWVFYIQKFEQNLITTGTRSPACTHADTHYLPLLINTWQYELIEAAELWAAVFKILFTRAAFMRFTVWITQIVVSFQKRWNVNTVFIYIIYVKVGPGQKGPTGKQVSLNKL